VSLREIQGGVNVGAFSTGETACQRRKVRVGEHAAQRLEDRGILEWQVVAGCELGEYITERLDGFPNPTVEIEELLPDGTEFKAVWAYLQGSGVAKLVTVHFFDEEWKR